MSVLKFAIDPHAVARVHDAVLCLAKFSEIVSLEATEDKVMPYRLVLGQELTSLLL